MSVETHLPMIEIQIELGDEFSHLLQPDKQAAAQAHIETAIDQLLQTLGIPARPHTILLPLAELADDPRPLRLRVDGRECFYPITLLTHAHTYAYRGIGPDRPGETNPLAEYAALVVTGILLHQPQVLMGLEQLGAYRLALAPLENQADWPPPLASLTPILHDVLAMRISLADQQTVAAVLAAGFHRGDSHLAIAEDLVSRLRPVQLEIRLHPDYLRALTLDSSEEDRAFFQLLRDGLFYELGQLYPPLRFVSTENLQSGWFSFRLNHLVSLPFPGLQPGEFAVDSPPDELPIAGVQRGTNPANGNPLSIVPAAALPQVPADLIVWSPLRFIVLQLAAVLRQHGNLMVDTVFTSSQLERLEDAYPDLIGAAREQISLAQLTRLLRSFAGEGLSIRNFRRILEDALDYDYVVVPQPELNIILDDRLPTDKPPGPDWLANPLNLAAFIRMRMEAEITYRYTRGSNSLAVYTIAPEIESLLLALDAEGQAAGAAAELSSRLLSACRRLLNPDPIQHQNTPVITTAEVRPHLRALLAVEFPQLPVIAYQELTSNLNLTVAERITLEPQE